MINQHLLVGTYDELLSYFTKKAPPCINPENGPLGYVEIPTMPIKKQLDDIYLKDEPLTGFVFYFIRNVINYEDGTFDVQINLGMEMVWIKDSDTKYPQPVFHEIIQHTVNTDVIDKLKSYATRH